MGVTVLNLQSYFERDGIYNFPCVPWLDGFKVIPINLGMLQIVADCHIHCKFFEYEETDTDSGIEIYAFAFVGRISCFGSDKRGHIAFEKVPSHVGKYGHECCFPFGVVLHTYTCPKEEVRTELVTMTCGNGEYVVSKVSYAYSASHIEETFVTCMSFGLVVNNYWFFLGDFGYIGYFIYEK